MGPKIDGGGLKKLPEKAPVTLLARLGGEGGGGGSGTASEAASEAATASPDSSSYLAVQLNDVLIIHPPQRAIGGEGSKSKAS